jgi:two-component system, NarL family, invasion response regulator UvrY
MRVLIADDHSITRKGLELVVREIFEDADICEAENGDILLARLGEAPRDLILVDVHMPGEMGILELIAGIRRRDAKVPVLVITAATELSFVMQSMKAGANGLVHKHMPPDELVRAIETVSTGKTYLHGDTAARIARSLAEERDVLPHEKLSPRELAILKGLAMGSAVKEVAADLGISDKTVATYVGRIRQKTGLTTPVDMARYAMQHDLVG